MGQKLAENPTWRLGEPENCQDLVKKVLECGRKEVEITSNKIFSCSNDQLLEICSSANVVLINGFMGEEFGLAGNEDRQEDFLMQLHEAVQTAKKLDCKKIHMMSGCTSNGSSYAGLKNNLTKSSCSLTCRFFDMSGTNLDDSELF